MKQADNGRLSGGQIFCLLTLFASGSVGTMGGGGAGRDDWLLMLLAGLCAVPVYQIYLRMAQAGGMRENLERALGRTAGAGACCLLGAVALVTAAVDVRMFIDFTSATALPRSPRFLAAALMTGALLFLQCAGLEALGRTAVPIVFLVTGMLLVSFLASLPQLDWGAVLPIAEEEAAELGKSFMRRSMVPFFESFFALAELAPRHNGRGSMRRVSLAAAVFSGGMLGSVLMKNTMLLGYPAVSQYYFPSYTAASVTVINEFFQRQELLVAAPFLLCQLVKASLCLRFAAGALGLRTRRAAPFLTSAAVLGLSLAGRGGEAEAVQPLRFYGQWLFVPLLLLPLAAALALRLRRNKKKPG